MSKHAFPLLGIVAAAVLVTFGAVVQGKLGNRWGAPVDVHAIAQNYEEFPEVVGDWKLLDSTQFSEKVEEMLQCHGHFSRTYMHSQTGQRLTVAVLTGPVGPTAVHTPDICYSSREYEISDVREAVDISTSANRNDTLWKMTFKSRGLSGHKLRAYYGWTANGVWHASESPRFEFAHEPTLSKLQIATVLPPAGDNSDTDACTEFLRDLIPLLQEHMFSTES